MHSLQAVKRAFFADHWPAGSFCKRSVRSTRTTEGQLESAVTVSCSEESFVCILQCSSGTVLHFHCRTCFWQDYCHCPNRKLVSFGIILSNPCEAALFSFRLFLSSSEKKRKKFDLTTANSAHVRTSAWPGEPTVSLLPLYVQCAICPCLIFDSLRHNSTSTDIHCLSFQGLLPAVGRCAGVRRTAR